jgi:hypothetical protein
MENKERQHNKFKKWDLTYYAYGKSKEIIVLEVL